MRHSSGWDDIIIGKGDKGCNAFRVFEIEGEHSISQNDVSFWITYRDGFEVGITIFKDTKQGRFLSAMIGKKVGLERINKYLQALILKNIDPKLLIEIIRESNKDSFEKGKRAKAKELKELLYIND